MAAAAAAAAALTAAASTSLTASTDKATRPERQARAGHKLKNLDPKASNC